MPVFPVNRRSHRLALAVGAGAVVTFLAYVDSRAFRAAALGLVAFGVAFAFLIQTSRLANVENRLRHMPRRVSSEAGAVAAHLWAVSLVTHAGGKLPPAPSGAAMDARSLHALIEHAVASGSKTVVEVGPGLSTVVLQLAARSYGIELPAVCLEHDRRWAARMDKLIEDFELPGVRTVVAPLESMPDGSRWYAKSSLDSLPAEIALLVVDGPPNVEQRGNRAPAVPMLIDRFRDGTIVFVHDTDREDEADMVARWTLEYPGLEVVDRGKKFVLLRYEESRSL